MTGPQLLAESRVLAVSLDHDLGGRRSVGLEMLGDFQTSSNLDLPAYWMDSFTPPHTPKGRTIERGPRIDSMEDAFTLISSGEIVNLFPRHVSRFWPRPDVAYLPVTDMAPLDFGLVWRGETETDLIRAFAAVVRDLGVHDPQGP